MIDAPLTWTAHPVHPIAILIGRAADDFSRFVCQVGNRRVLMTPDELAEFWAVRENGIRNEKDEPLRYGYEPPHWKDADRLRELGSVLCIFGGNQAGKTEYVLKRAMELLTTKENVNVLFLQNNELASKQLHQKTVWKYMPKEWKTLRRTRGAEGNIGYDPKTGFTDNIFTTPLGGTAIFGNYGQALDKYEGLQFDLIVADENLPLKWFEALKRGLSTRRGKLLWAFTPIEGMTPAISEVAAGAQTLESRPVDPRLLSPTERHVADCPIGEMPYTAVRNGVHIIYFHSILNDFGDYENLISLYGHKEKSVIERRFYGFARRITRVLLPKFGAVHILPHDEMMRRLAENPHSKYHLGDPAGARNMFQGWVGVDEHRRHYIYREWPDVPRHGEWAVPSEDPRKWDGDPGPAQPTLGYGVLDYKKLILMEEGWRLTKDGWKPGPDGVEQIEDRYLDPRSGAARSIADNEGGSSLMDRFAEEQRDHAGVIVGPPMHFRPAPGLPENEGIHGNQEGVQGINDLLAYDETQPIVALLNEPRLFVSDRCLNFIWAMQNYTSNDGAKGACKDPMDILRYMSTADLEHVDPANMVSGGGSY